MSVALVGNSPSFFGLRPVRFQGEGRLAARAKHPGSVVPFCESNLLVAEGTTAGLRPVPFRVLTLAKDSEPVYAQDPNHLDEQAGEDRKAKDAPERLIRARRSVGFHRSRCRDQRRANDTELARLSILGRSVRNLGRTTGAVQVRETGLGDCSFLCARGKEKPASTEDQHAETQKRP